MKSKGNEEREEGKGKKERKGRKERERKKGNGARIWRGGWGLRDVNVNISWLSFILVRTEKKK